MVFSTELNEVPRLYYLSRAVVLRANSMAET